MKKLFKLFIFNMLLMFIFTSAAYAAGKYIADDAKVLKPATIDAVNNNLAKIENNTEVTIKFDVVKSLGGKDIVNYGKQYASSNIKGDKYLLFVVSTDDRKNKLIVGPGVNGILSDTEVKSIESLPNDSFKVNKFDDGIISVGKTLDQKVTTKAVKTGKAEVKTDGYSTTVQAKPNYLKIFLIILLIAGIVVGVFIYFKRKADREYEKHKKKIYEEAGMSDYLENNSSTFKSTKVSTEKEKPTAPPIRKVYNKKIDEDVSYHVPPADSYTRHSHTINDRRSSGTGYTGSGYTTVNHTTYVDNSRRDNGSDFVEGMMMGSMMNELSHNHEEHHHHDDYREEHHHYEEHREEYNEPTRDEEPTYEEPVYEEPKTYESSNWDNDQGSSWDSDNSNGSGEDW